MFQTYMLQEKNTVNNFEISRNQRESSNNRLTNYFENSSFLAQQEELALFIKNLPIIRIEQLKSINKLIDILIRQNEILGNKCQQNILTVKEMYSKHEDLIRANRQLQSQMQEASKHLEYNNINKKQLQECQERINKSQLQVKRKEQTIDKIQKQLEQTKLQNQYYHDSLQQLVEIFKLITERNVKKSSEKIKEMANKSNSINTLSWIDWSELQRFMKQEKKKLKYYPKIKETIQLFCSRFIKISEYVPVNSIKEECNRQVDNLLQIIDDLLMLKKKNHLLSSQSRGSDFSVAKQGNFFQGLLNRIIKQHQNNSVAKAEIATELLQVKKELNESKKYYEQYLIKAKLQFEDKIRKMQEQLVQKNHLLQFYENEKEKTTKEQLQMKRNILELQEALKSQRYTVSQKNQQLMLIQAKLQSLKSQLTTKQSQIRQQWEENVRTYQYKLKQKNQLLEQEQQQRKNTRLEFQHKLAELKTINSELQENNKRLSFELKELATEKEKQKQHLTNSLAKSQQQRNSLQKSLSVKNSQNEELSHRLQKQCLEVRKLKDQLSQNECEKNLQAAYIKQLQNKNSALQDRLESLATKKSEDKTAKKELTAIKQTMMQQKKYTLKMQQNYQRRRQENQRLKSVIKSMKKQLEQVYVQFNQLKTIENDRQKLLVQIQKSDRQKQQFYRQYQATKLALVKLDQQNKGLVLEVKHYRNALSRIEALR